MPGSAQRTHQASQTAKHGLDTFYTSSGSKRGISGLPAMPGWRGPRSMPRAQPSPVFSDLRGALQGPSTFWRPSNVGGPNVRFVDGPFFSPSWADDCGVGGQPNAPGGDCGWHQMSCLLLVTGSRTGPEQHDAGGGLLDFDFPRVGHWTSGPVLRLALFFLPLALFIGASPVHGDGSGIKRHRLPPLGKSCTSHRRSLDCGRAATSDLASSPARSFQL